MRVAQIRDMDISNGLDVGVALFVQGCNRHCYNCCNQETWDFDGGFEFTSDIEQKFISLASRTFIHRVSILGGEPLAKENRNDVVNLIAKIESNHPDKSVWFYTGYTIDEILSDNVDLHNVDYLVDGEYVDSLRDLTLEFRGSSNQHIWKNVNGTWELFR